jgi:hypothetical protein
MASKKEAPIRAIFDDISTLTKEDILESPSFLKLIKDKTFDSITKAFKSNSVFATLFEINDSACYIEIHKNDWISALESCISMYVEDEDYDTCGKITTLIREIKEKNSKRLVKSK